MGVVEGGGGLPANGTQVNTQSMLAADQHERMGGGAYPSARALCCTLVGVLTCTMTRQFISKRAEALSMHARTRGARLTLGLTHT